MAKCRLCERDVWSKGLCKKYSLAAWHAANPEKKREYNKRMASKPGWALKNRKRVLQWQSANPIRVKERKSAWYKLHINLHRERTAAWRRANPEKHAAEQARRRSIKLRAIPKWANQFVIAEAYALAKLRTKRLGFKWEVDHIVPLISPLVCGLHCEANIQVIPESQNRSKANRIWPDMP